MIKRSLRGGFKNRRFESVELDDAEDLLESAKYILDENDFDLYDRRQDGSWVEEFYINNELWTIVFLSVDSKTENPVYVKVFSPQNNNSINHRIRNVDDLRRFEDDLF